MNAKTIFLIAVVFIPPFLAPITAQAETEGPQKAAVSHPDYDSRRLIRRAEYLSEQGKYEDALLILEKVKTMEQSKKQALKVEKLIAKILEKQIEREKKQEELRRQTEKKRMLAEVDRHWLPPQPEKKKKVKAAEPEKLSLLLEHARRPVPFIDFTDATLREVVEFLAKAAQVNIVIDEKAVPAEEHVTVHLKDIPMLEALNHILKTKKLLAKVEDNLILVTNEEALAGDLEVRVYDVQDLVGKLHDFPAEPFNFGEIAKNQSKGDTHS